MRRISLWHRKFMANNCIILKRTRYSNESNRKCSLQIRLIPAGAMFIYYLICFLSEICQKFENHFDLEGIFFCAHNIALSICPIAWSWAPVQYCWIIFNGSHISKTDVPVVFHILCSCSRASTILFIVVFLVLLRVFSLLEWREIERERGKYSSRENEKTKQKKRDKIR